MNDKFDELTTGLAQSVTRRQALRRFGVGMAGIALAFFGLSARAATQSACQICIEDCKAMGNSEKDCKMFCAPSCRKFV